MKERQRGERNRYLEERVCEIKKADTLRCLLAAPLDLGQPDCGARTMGQGLWTLPGFPKGVKRCSLSKAE